MKTLHLFTSGSAHVVTLHQLLRVSEWTQTVLSVRTILTQQFLQFMVNPRFLLLLFPNHRNSQTSYSCAANNAEARLQILLDYNSCKQSPFFSTISTHLHVRMIPSYTGSAHPSWNHGSSSSCILGACFLQKHCPPCSSW